jgi:hypothetical protein
MRIAIYGDSFASYEIESRDIQGPAWVDVVKEKYNTVTNYAAQGTSFYRSYKQFQEHHDKYDVNIFLITETHRLYSEFLEENVSRAGYNNLSSLLTFQMRNEKFPPENYELLKNVYSSLVTYYAYWKDYEVEKEFHYALLDKLKRSTNNTIFINCFNDSVEDIGDETSLLEVQFMEQHSLGFVEKYKNNGINFGHIKDDKYFTDYRKCHLSEENNMILANKIIDAIENNRFEVPLMLSDFVVPSKDIEYYVKWKNIYDSD